MCSVSVPVQLGAIHKECTRRFGGGHGKADKVMEVAPIL